jgi:hypothetical protein
MSHKSSMDGSGESYSGAVPAKQPNKGEPPPAEAVEGRPLTQENTRQPDPRRTPSREDGPSGIRRARITEFDMALDGAKVLSCRVAARIFYGA